MSGRNIQPAEGTLDVKHNWHHLLKCVVVDCLPGNREILPARQGVLLLVITHSSFAAALVEVVVWLVDVYAKFAEDTKIFSLKTVLLINRVTDISMVLMAGAFARVAAREYLRIQCWSVYPPYGPSVSSIESPVC